MPLQPFSEAGVDAKIAELYALSDAALQVQADKAGSDFKSFIADNFLLTTAQANYLTGMDSRFLDYAGKVLHTAFPARAGVSLINNPPVTWNSKFIRVNNGLDVVDDGNGGYAVSGSVTFSVTYS